MLQSLDTGIFLILNLIQNGRVWIINFHSRTRNQYRDLQFFPMVSLPSVLFYMHSLQYYVLDDKPNEAEMAYFVCVGIVNGD